jgi:hypothetical protein
MPYTDPVDDTEVSFHAWAFLEGGVNVLRITLSDDFLR